MSVVWACMPFLVAYPLAISTVTYGLARKVARQNRQLLELSVTDELTGLANRRACRSVAEQELERHRRTGRPALLVVLDIDRFKRVNDRFGHPAGDELLRSVTCVLRQCTRATDTPARYAGDEFMIVMPDTDLAGGEAAANRIRECLASLSLDSAPALRCTVSIGAAEAHHEMADVEDWIQQADAALYRAKDAGRDCFVASPSAHRDLPRDQAPAQVATAP
jgi:diguanylate cyclase